MIKQLEKAIEVLEAIGIPNDAITKFKSDKEEDVADIAVADLKKGIFDRHKTALLSDDVFLKPIVDETRIGTLNARSNQLQKKFADLVTKAEFDAIPDKNRYDDLVELIIKKVAESKPSGDSAKEIKELHEKLRESEAKIEKLEKEDIPAIETKFTQLEASKHLAGILRKEFDKYAKDMVTDAENLWPAFETRIHSDYDFAPNGTTVKVLKKGATSPAVDDKFHEINFPDYAKKILIENKFLKASNGEPAKPPITEPAPIRKQVSPGLSKAEETIAYHKQMREAEKQK